MRPFSDTSPPSQLVGKSPALLWRIWSLAVPYCIFNSKYPFKGYKGIKKQTRVAWLFMSWLNDSRLLPLVPASTCLTYKVPNPHKIGQRVPVKL